MAVRETVNVSSKYIFIVCLIVHSTVARIHKLKLENEDRKQIDLSTFGFLKNGSLAVNITNFSYEPLDMTDLKENTYGFTLDKTVSTGISPYLEGKQGSCILTDKTLKKDDSVSVLFLRMNLKSRQLIIERKGKDLKDLRIFASDSGLHGRVRRDAAATEKDVKHKENAVTGETGHIKSEAKTEPPATTPAPKLVTKATLAPKVKDTTAMDDKDVKVTKEVDGNSMAEDKQNKTKPAAGDKANLAGPGKHLMLVNNTIRLEVDAKGRYSAYFLVLIDKEAEQGLYNLFFHNCHNYGKEGGASIVNFTAYITETNKDNYLSAGQMPLPTLYFCLCVLYFFAGCYWFYVLRSSEKETVFKIHYLMLTLVFVKSVALLFHAVNFYFIQKEGHHEEAFAILYYITHLMKGALLFITIVLIGAGWAFVKHILSDRDKKIFIIVIPLQILANVAQIIIEETEEGQSQYTTWKEVFILVDLLCCGAILFPVVWSIRHLQEASSTDGKAAINLAKLKIFRHFYIMIVCYIYFTRIIVYLLKITVPFQYEWLDELFRELATFIFFIVTGYKFRPASNNPYLQVSTDSDDEIEMDEVVTKSGALDDVVRVNVRTKPTDGSTPTKRESSHEYD